MLNQSEGKKDIVAVVTNRAVAILGMLYLIFIPSGVIKKQFEPVDIGILMVVLIANSNIIEKIKDVKLSKDGVEASFIEQKLEEVSKQAEENKKAIEAQQEAIKKQDETDREALKATELQLSEIVVPEGLSERLHENISHASPVAIGFIYQKAKDARHNASEDKWSNPEHFKRGVIERTIPIFEALIEAKKDLEDEKKCHRFYAQLGYALKDQEKPELEKAERNLDSAIDLWKKQNPTSPLPPVYCFNWLICIGKLERRPKLKPDEMKERIEAARTCERFKKALDQPEMNWIRDNYGQYFCNEDSELDNSAKYCRREYYEQEKQPPQLANATQN